MKKRALVEKFIGPGHWEKLKPYFKNHVLFKGSNWDNEKYIGQIPCVNCNDTFAWGCADGEELTKDNIEIFYQSIEDAGEKDGPDLFCARVREMRPQGACYGYYDEKNWPLFNACGPERETGFGNPYAPGEYQRPTPKVEDE